MEDGDAALSPATLMVTNRWIGGAPISNQVWSFWAVVVLLTIFAIPKTTAAQSPSDQERLKGVWEAERYLLAEGTAHPLRGRIFFDERDWQVLFFVLDSTGSVARGSAEGGVWRVSHGKLILSHRYHLSAGEALPGLAASSLRMLARLDEDLPEEPTDFEVKDEVLTLHFPSGNRMIFRRR